MLAVENAIWLFIVVFMLHDFEEIITVEHWATNKQHLLKSKGNALKKRIWQFWNVGSYQFAKRDVVIFIIMALIVFLKVQFYSSAWSAVLFICFLMFVLIHNMIHILQTILFKAYTPGLYTAILLVTPYAIYLLFRL